MNSNMNTSLPQVATKVNRQRQDKINLARSKGEYAPKWTQKSAAELTSKPAERSLEDEMLWM
jgi:hypothetical protein